MNFQEKIASIEKDIQTIFPLVSIYNALLSIIFPIFGALILSTAFHFFDKDKNDLGFLILSFFTIITVIQIYLYIQIRKVDYNAFFERRGMELEEIKIEEANKQISDEKSKLELTIIEIRQNYEAEIGKFKENIEILRSDELSYKLELDISVNEKILFSKFLRTSVDFSKLVNINFEPERNYIIIAQYFSELIQIFLASKEAIGISSQNDIYSASIYLLTNINGDSNTDGNIRLFHRNCHDDFDTYPYKLVSKSKIKYGKGMVGSAFTLDSSDPTVIAHNCVHSLHKSNPFYTQTQKNRDYFGSCFCVPIYYLDQKIPFASLFYSTNECDLFDALHIQEFYSNFSLNLTACFSIFFSKINNETLDQMRNNTDDVLFEMEKFLLANKS